jgi:hypothetical protein
MDLTNPSAKHLKNASLCKYQLSQQSIQQDETQIDTECGSGQRGNIESGFIPTTTSGYADPQKWRDKKVQNRVGIPNA